MTDCQDRCYFIGNEVWLGRVEVINSSLFWSEYDLFQVKQNEIGPTWYALRVAMYVPLLKQEVRCFCHKHTLNELYHVPPRGSHVYHLEFADKQNVLLNAVKSVGLCTTRSPVRQSKRFRIFCVIVGIEQEEMHTFYRWCIHKLQRTQWKQLEATEIKSNS